MTPTRTGPGECSLVGLPRSPLGGAGDTEIEGRGPWELCPPTCPDPSTLSSDSQKEVGKAWAGPAGLLAGPSAVPHCVARGKSLPSLAGPQLPHL